jgi:Ca2+-binding EF-hand superfamily protein
MKDIFDTYDTKSQGFIKTSLIGNILRTLGFNPLESEIQRATREVDPQSKIFHFFSS